MHQPRFRDSMVGVGPPSPVDTDVALGWRPASAGSGPRVPPPSIISHRDGLEVVRSAGAAVQRPAPVFAGGQIFASSGTLIYETTTQTPVYNIMTLNTRSGEPWQLQLSRLLPTEARRLATLDPDNPGRVKYDQDLTLYLSQKVVTPISIGQTSHVCIRGCKKGTMSGLVIMEKFPGRKVPYKFCHLTKKSSALRGQAEMEKYRELMHKRGYRASDDWRKSVLFSVRKSGNKVSVELEWSDEDDKPVAVEKDGSLHTKPNLDTETRDLIVSCWMSKAWIEKTQ